VQSKSWRKGGAGNIHLLKYFAMELEEGEDWGALRNYCGGYCGLLFVVFGEVVGILCWQVVGWFGIWCQCDQWGPNVLGEAVAGRGWGCGLLAVVVAMGGIKVGGGLPVETINHSVVDATICWSMQSNNSSSCSMDWKKNPIRL